MRPRRPTRRTLEALLTSAGIATFAGHAAAQEPPPPPPPLTVPTAPVAVPTTYAAPPPPATPPPAPKATPSPNGSKPAKDEAKDKDEDKDKAKGKDASAPSVNNDGTFRISGTGGKPAAKSGKSGNAAAKKPVEQGLVAHWPGFHLTSDGGSEVMVEFSKTLPAPVEHRAKGSITYVFKGVRLTKKNNANPLITVHFNTPIAVARLVPKGNELHLVIELRGGVEALPSTGIRPGAEGQGAQFFAKFAPGHFIDEATEGDEVPNGSPKKLKADAKKAEKGEKSDTPPSTNTNAPTSGGSGPKTGPQP
jgi:hypothetical protein